MTPSRRKVEDDLSLIRTMMDAGRKRAGLDGSFMLLWGPLLALAFGVNYLAIIGALPGYAGYIWWPVLLIGWLLSFRIGFRRERSGAAKSVAGRVYGISWLGTGIAILCYFVPSSFASGLNPLAITVLTCGLFGTSYFVMARTTDLRFLDATAIGWYALLVFYATKGALVPYDLLVLMAASLFLICVPGVLLARLKIRDETITDDRTDI